MIPPFITVGSSSPPSSRVATNVVVVVFPCVPAIAMFEFSRISSANISDLFTIGIPLFRAPINSGFDSETAVEITTTAAFFKFEASCS